MAPHSRALHHSSASETRLSSSGGTESVVASKPACIAFVSSSSPSSRKFGLALDALADAHPGVAFAKVDVDTPDAAQQAQEQGIGRDAQLPIFKLFKNGLNQATITGGDASALEAALVDVDKTAS